MTPDKTRATTLQEKFGFVDDDLKTPVHDSIMMWLDGEIDRIVSAHVLNKIKLEIDGAPAWEKRAENEYRKKNPDRYTPSGALVSAYPWEGLGDLPTPRYLGIDSKVWESPIKSAKDFVVGFVDMLVVARYQHLSYTDAGYFTTKEKAPKWELFSQQHNFVFEVKPSIRSVGEVIRQIRMYQQFKDGDYFIVSPDDRFVDVLRSQGIYFIKAQREGEA